MTNASNAEGEKPYQKCGDTPGVFCKTLDERVQIIDDKYKKGFGINMKSPKGYSFVAGVAYRTSNQSFPEKGGYRGDKGVFLNWCPWCGNELGEKFLKEARENAKKENGVANAD
jgi:hypothetical protein